MTLQSHTAPADLSALMSAVMRLECTYVSTRYSGHVAEARGTGVQSSDSDSDLETGRRRRDVAHDVHEFASAFGRVELPHEPRELRLRIRQVQQQPHVLQVHEHEYSEALVRPDT